MSKQKRKLREVYLAIPVKSNYGLGSDSSWIMAHENENDAKADKESYSKYHHHRVIKFREVKQRTKRKSK
jgi:hypothetical protein